MPGRASGIAFALAAVALLAPAAWADSTVTSLDLEQTATWQLPSGAPMPIEWTLDGRLLLVLDACDGRMIYILDRQLALLGTVMAPFELRGASWSASARWLLAWGPDGDRYNITAWDVPSLALNGTVVPLGLLTVELINTARFYASDEILVVCGRDGEGRSRINVIEMRTRSLRSDIELPADRTVFQLAFDGRTVPCVEEGGAIVPFSSQNWSGWGTPRNMTGEVTAYCIGEDGPWLAGDSNGVVQMFNDSDGGVYFSLELGQGPVLGLAYGSSWPDYIIAAVPGDGGGGRIQAWTQYTYMDAPSGKARLVREQNTTSPITAMARIPRARDNVTVGYADGRLVNYWMNATLVPGYIPQGPDGDDGPGLGGWLRTYGGLVALVAVALVLAVAYAWLRKREG